MPAPLYELRGAAKFFQLGGATIRAVDGVDLTLDAEEFVAIEGPSGSGKTTLLQLLGALDKPSSGEVHFEGRDLVTLSDGELAELRLRSFGFIFQQFNLLSTLTALQNVEAGLAPLGIAAGELRERSLAMLAEVGLRARAVFAPRISPVSSRAVSSSASRSRGRYPPRPESYWPMSRPAISIPAAAPTSSRCSPVWPPSTAPPSSWRLTTVSSQPRRHAA